MERVYRQNAYTREQTDTVSVVIRSNNGVYSLNKYANIVRHTLVCPHVHQLEARIDALPHRRDHVSHHLIIEWKCCLP